MGDRTSIEWTDATWNPVTGCTKVSPGCKFCYAERITERGGEDFGTIRLHPERLLQPLRCREPRRIFVGSMSDLFHERISFDFIDQVLGIVAVCPQHTFQVLTKRADRLAAYCAPGFPDVCERIATQACSVRRQDVPGWPPLANLWIGVSAETEAEFDSRVSCLLQSHGPGRIARVLFASLEPLLGPIDCEWALDVADVGDVETGPEWTRALEWVIVGGESGGPPERSLVYRQAETVRGEPRAHWYEPRPEALAWMRSIRDQCLKACVPFFFKQWGGPSPTSGGRLLDGRTWDEMPAASE